ncbi:MAG: Ig-like domain-containing protein [Pseudomonadales bacterium]|jgi:hypothetical protein
MFDARIQRAERARVNPAHAYFPRWARIGALLLLGLAAAACGGGGGGGGGNSGSGSTSAAPSLNLFGTVLDIEMSLTTTADVITLRGELNPEYTRDDTCDNSTIVHRQIMDLSWSNLTTGERGNGAAYLDCRPSGLIFGPYIFETWTTTPIGLDWGENVLEVDTYDEGKHIGRQRFTVRRVDGVAPTIRYRYPGVGTNVPTNHVIQVYFSEAMDATSLTGRLRLIDALGSAVSGTDRYDPLHHVLTFEPDADLGPAGTYRVELDGRVSDAHGVELGEDEVWTFDTGDAPDTQGPFVVERLPDGTCVCSQETVVLSVVFNEPLDLDSITRDTFYVQDDAGQSVSGELHVVGDRLEFRPESAYANDRAYTATITAGVRDATGYAMSQTVAWTFRYAPVSALGSWETLRQLDRPTLGATSAWDGMALHLWGQASGPYKDASECAPDDLVCQDEIVTRGLGRRFDPNAGEVTITAIARSPLRDAVLLRTDREILRYGGQADAGPVAEAQRYDPMVADWENLSSYWEEDGTYYFLKGLVHHTAIWTGTEMIVWGGDRGFDGLTNRGWRYDTLHDTWSVTGPAPSVDASLHLTEDPNAPAARQQHAAVWTGTEMFVFGGRDAAGQPLGDSAAYDPATNTWRAISGADRAGLGAVSAVWTGARVLVWDGGQDVPLPENGDRQASSSIRQYDPVADEWTLSSAPWAPRFLPELGAYQAFWTGDAMLAVGVEAFELQGYDPEFGQLRRMTIGAYLYRPETDEWLEGSKLEVTNVRVGSVPDAFTAAWTGDRVLLFDGESIYSFTPGAIR